MRGFLPPNGCPKVLLAEVGPQIPFVVQKRRDQIRERREGQGRGEFHLLLIVFFGVFIICRLFRVFMTTAANFQHITIEGI